MSIQDSSKTIRHFYSVLRRYHGIRAYQALQMARARFEFEEAGGEFNWEYEQENPRDVFGEPCPNSNCRNPKCMGVHYNADAQHYSLSLRVDGLTLESLGMIEEGERHFSERGYGFLVECELAVEAVENLPIAEEVL